MYWDTHMHCRFSGDSTADPESMILSAIAKNLNGICFTDHIDYDYPEIGRASCRERVCQYV